MAIDTRQKRFSMMSFASGLDGVPGRARHTAAVSALFRPVWEQLNPRSKGRYFNGPVVRNH